MSLTQVQMRKVCVLGCFLALSGAAPPGRVSAVEPGPSWRDRAGRAGPAATGAAPGLGDLEQMALQAHPTLAQAAAQVEAARARAFQAGLFPNPTVAYIGEQIGSEGKAGPQGIFIDQLVVTGGKLRLNRAQYTQEANQMIWQALAQQYRVLNTVGMSFYRVLALQRLVDVTADLTERAEETVRAVEGLVKKGQAERADLLESRIEAQHIRNPHEEAQTQQASAWSELAALVGNPSLAPTALAGNLEEDGPELDWSLTLSHLLATSPEVQFARAEVCRNQLALQREQAELRPNIQVRAGTQYDFASDKQQALVQVGVPLPLFNKNQGNIRAAQAELARARAGLNRAELSLHRRLAMTFGRYRSDRSNVRRYREEFLPQAREVYDLRLESFRKGRVSGLR